MAISNMLNEPRREITETLVGLAVIGVLFFGDYHFATWFEEVSGENGQGGCPWPLGLIIGVVFFFMAVLALVATHALGDGICNMLGRFGADPRPGRRYGRF